MRSGVPRDQYSHILGKLSYIYGILIICKLCLHSGHRKMTKNSYIKAIFQASHAVSLPGVSRTRPLKAAIHPGSPSHQAGKCFLQRSQVNVVCLVGHKSWLYYGA